MDNFCIDVVSEGEEHFKLAFKLLRAPFVVAWSYRPTKGLILYWYDSPSNTKLPYKMTLEEAADFAWGWLCKQDFGSKPDIDGDCEKGWRIYTESWGSVHDDNGAKDLGSFVAVQPAWAMYGK
jgi:hypothetical protein